MRTTAAFVAIAVALALQMSLARFTIGRETPIDLVLVAVVYAALARGPVTGMLCGSVGGLAQDALSGGLVGVGGLAKTLVGFAAGVVGAQFIVAQPIPRLAVFFTSTLVHGACFYGVYALIGSRGSNAPYGAVLTQAVVNGVVGVIAFQAVAMAPGLLDRRRARSGFRRR